MYATVHTYNLDNWYPGRPAKEVGALANANPITNRLLEALPHNALRRIQAESELVELTRGDILYDAGERIRDVYFLVDSFVSLVAKANDDACVEVALIGEEGMVGTPLLLGIDTKPLRVLVQGSGKAWRVRAERFRRAVATNQDLFRSLSGYVSSRMIQLAQSTACCRLHSLEARLARRLLLTQDKLHSNEICITQQILAKMLGTGRPTVNRISNMLQRRKLILWNRRGVTILDRTGLEKASCECYRNSQRRSHASILARVDPVIR